MFHQTGTTSPPLPLLKAVKVDLGTSAQNSSAKHLIDESISLALLNAIAVTVVR